MRFLLMRHGQTDLNIQKRLQGSSDIPLNARGRQQAAEARAWLVEQNLQPTKVITSPLGRAIETGCIAAGIDISSYEENSILADNKPEEIELNENLIEMAFGIYEQKNVEEEHPEFLESCFDYPETFVAPEGGEDYDQVVSRAGNVIEELRRRMLAGEFDEEDIVLLVSHGATGHAILEYLKKTPRSAYWDVDINNCAVVELLLSTDGTGDDYRFLSDGFEKNW